MGRVIVAMTVIMVVGGGVLGVAAGLHHLAGSVEAQARLRRRRFEVLWHAYRIRLRVASRLRAARRFIAVGMTAAAARSTGREGGASAMPEDPVEVAGGPPVP